jgi:hypothetical protein
VPEPSDAWVLRGDRDPCGTCFAIERHHLVTCAHVIKEALSLPESLGDREFVGKTVEIQHRGTEAAQGKVKAKVIDYRRRLSDADTHIVGRERRWADVAVLELEAEALKRLDEGQIVIWAAVLANPWLLGGERRFHVYGPSAGGARVEGMMKVGDDVDERLLLEPYPGQPRIEGGFSGAPVRHDDGTVLGMCVLANEETGQARIIPATVLQEIAAELSIEVNPYRPGRPPLLKEEELDILKNWTKPIAAIRTELVQPGKPTPDLPLFILNCDDVLDYPGRFLVRLGYELAQDFGEEDLLEVYDEFIPSSIDFSTLEARMQEYLVQLARRYGGARKEASRIAIARGCRVAHLPDVDLTNAEEVKTALRILQHWREGFTLTRSRLIGKSFCAVLATRERVNTAVLDAFKAQPELSEGFRACVVEDFRKVTPRDLAGWAKLAYRHVRRAREAVMIQSAERMIYAGRSELTMADWCDGFQVHGRTIIGANLGD